MVAEINRGACFQCFFIAALDRLDRVVQLRRTLLDHFFEVLTIMFNFSFERPLMQSALQTCQDSARPEWLNEIVIRTGSHRCHTYIHVVRARDDQKCHVRIAAAYFGEEVHAADPRHMEVGNDGIELLALKSHERFLAIAGGGAMERRTVQDEGKKLASSRFVVHDKDTGGRMLVRWTIGGTACGSWVNKTAGAIPVHRQPRGTVARLFSRGGTDDHSVEAARCSSVNRQIGLLP